VGLFITFEGGEGVGKTTQAALLVQLLKSDGQDVVALREPGGTPLGDYLRGWLKSSDRPLAPEAELLLFTAARAELVRSVIQPALDAGATVVLDRYADSTTAYQGYGRRLPMYQVKAANDLATGGLTPDLTILLDAPIAPTLQRALKRSGPDGRRFEDTDPAFHRRVRAGFKRVARRAPKRWLVLDALAAREEVAGAIGDCVRTLQAG
jgi:dTMP kinase